MEIDDGTARRCGRQMSTIEAPPAAQRIGQPAAPEPAHSRRSRGDASRPCLSSALISAAPIQWTACAQSGAACQIKALNGLRPIMMVKEHPTGLGMQLRLVAGPLSDAAAARQRRADRSSTVSAYEGAEVAPANPDRRYAGAPRRSTERTEQLQAR